MKIGYVNPEYGTIRNVIGGDSDAEYTRIRSFAGMANKLFELSGIGAKILRNTGYAYFGGLKLHRIDLLHFFDKIAVWPCKNKYVTTFEDVLPRNMGKGKLFHMGLDSLHSSYCRRLIAFSDCAREHQIIFDKMNGISEVDKKITVLLPPQKTLITDDLIQRRNVTGTIRFAFIGKSFFRKGAGMSMFNALNAIRKSGADIELYLIGNIDYTDYASLACWDVPLKAHQFIEENKNWIHYYEYLPNERALSLLRQCHIGLLPSRDDTFGYSVLEMQASGLPCITTDVWALPEINNEQCGWVVNLRKNKYRQANYFTIDGLKEIDNDVEKGIVAACEEILQDRECLIRKGMESLNRVKAFHSPEMFSHRLHRIYTEAL